MQTLGPILKYLAGIAASFALLLAGLVGLSWFLLSDGGAPLNTDVVFHGRPAWGTESQYLIFNRHRLVSPADRLFVIGASNAREALQPGLLGSKIRGYQVNDIALGGANITEVRQTVHLVYQSLAKARCHNMFVLGITYLQFEDNKTRWGGATDLAVEMTRFDLFRATGGEDFSPSFPSELSLVVSYALRPVIIEPYVEKWIARHLFPTELVQRLRLLLGSKKTGGDDARRVALQEFLLKQTNFDALTIDAGTRAELLREQKVDSKNATSLPAEQFVEIGRLATEIERHGDVLVLVDFPLPRWHLAGIRALDRSYKAQLGSVLKRFAELGHGPYYLDLRALDDPNNFYDSTHLRPRMWSIICARLADFLEKQKLIIG